MNRYIMGMKAKAAIIFLTMLSSSEKYTVPYNMADVLVRETCVGVFLDFSSPMKDRSERLKERVN